MKGYCLLVFIGFLVPVGGWVNSTPVVAGGEGVVVVVSIGVVVVVVNDQYVLCLMSS